MNKRTIEERVAEQEKKLELAVQKVQQYKEQLKALENRKADEEHRKQTHLHIACGSEISALYEHTLSIEEVHMLINHLRDEMNKGIFSLVKKEEVTYETETVIKEKNEEEENLNDIFDLF